MSVHSHTPGLLSWPTVLASPYFVREPKVRVATFAILMMTHKTNWSTNYFILPIMPIATPLLEECEDDTHIPEMGTWESSETLKISELDFRGQNTLY